MGDAKSYDVRCFGIAAVAITAAVPLATSNGPMSGLTHGRNEYVRARSPLEGRVVVYRLVKMYAEQKQSPPTNQRSSASTTDPTPQPRTCGGPLLGTWKLRSFTTEFQDTRQMIEPFGAHPSGYLSYSADCRMYAIVVGEGRKPPVGEVPTDAEKIELFRGMGAYAGTYTIEGDKVIHHVDISWNEAWTGTAQVRQFKVEGNSLQILAESSEDGRPGLSTLVWTKVQP